MGKSWVVYHRKRRWVGRRPSAWLPMGEGEFKVLTRTLCLGMRFLPFRGIRLWGVWSRGRSVGMLPSEAVQLREITSVKKVKLAERGAVKHLAALESEYLAEVQPVVEALGMLQYEDSSPRQPGYLGIWTQGSTWFVRLQDKDADAQMTCEGRTVDEALDTLAVLLGSENAPWEPCSRRKGKKA